MEKTNKTKKKIIECAEKLFSEKGYDKTSIDDITKLAETTKSLFYYYFKTKKDILYTLMKIRLEDAVKDLAEKRKNNKSPATKEDLYKNCISLIKENESIFKIAIFEFLKTNGCVNIITELPKELFDEVKDVFEFTEKEQLKLILTMIKITVFHVLRKSMCEKFNMEECEFEKMYMEEI